MLLVFAHRDGEGGYSGGVGVDGGAASRSRPLGLGE